MNIKALKQLSKDEERVFELIQEDNTSAVIELVQRGRVRVDCLDKNGMSLLDQACFKANEKLVGFFLELGANPDNRAHEQGYTSLMFAAIAGNTRICQMLLDAGASPEAQNIIGKTASELAAFVGQYECVSVISSYISFEDVDKIVHPKGVESDVIYPKAFIGFIHKLTRTHEFHPIRLAFDVISNADIVVVNRKKLLFTIDFLFERQLRSKQPNEIMAMKLWLIFYSLREMFQLVDGKKNAVDKTTAETNTEIETAPVVAAEIEAITTKIQQFARQLLICATDEIIRPKEERFLRTAVAAYPYKHSLVFKGLAQHFKEIPFGSPPAAFPVICNAILGARAVETAHFCRTCGVVSAKKRCRNCKSYYCSVECQKFDWPIHKKCCEQLKQRNLLALSDESEHCAHGLEHNQNDDDGNIGKIQSIEKADNDGVMKNDSE